MHNAVLPGAPGLAHPILSVELDEHKVFKSRTPGKHLGDGASVWTWDDHVTISPVTIASVLTFVVRDRNFMHVRPVVYKVRPRPKARLCHDPTYNPIASSFSLRTRQGSVALGELASAGVLPEPQPASVVLTPHPPPQSGLPAPACKVHVSYRVARFNQRRRSPASIHPGAISTEALPEAVQQPAAESDARRNARHGLKHMFMPAPSSFNVFDRATRRFRRASANAPVAPAAVTAPAPAAPPPVPAPPPPPAATVTNV